MATPNDPGPVPIPIPVAVSAPQPQQFKLNNKIGAQKHLRFFTAGFYAGSSDIHAAFAAFCGQPHSTFDG